MPQPEFAESDLLVRDEAALVSAEVDGELVGLSVEKGLCYGLNHVGTRIWHLLAQPRTLDDLCRQLTREFHVDPQQCRAEVRDLLAQLWAEGLVTRAAGA